MSVMKEQYEKNRRILAVKLRWARRAAVVASGALAFRADGAALDEIRKELRVLDRACDRAIQEILYPVEEMDDMEDFIAYGDNDPIPEDVAKMLRWLLSA